MCDAPICPSKTVDAILDQINLAKFGGEPPAEALKDFTYEELAVGFVAIAETSMRESRHVLLHQKMLEAVLGLYERERPGFKAEFGARGLSVMDRVEAAVDLELREKMLFAQLRAEGVGDSHG